MSEPNQLSDDASNAAETNRSQLDDAVIDALLAEVFGKTVPPNQSVEIMQKLRETPLVAHPTHLPDAQKRGSRKANSSAGSVRMIASKVRPNWPLRLTLSIAALAASGLFVVIAWEFSEPREFGSQPIANTPQQNSIAKRAAAKTSAQPSVVASAPQVATDRPAPRGITIAVDTPESYVSNPTSSAITLSPQPAKREIDPIRLVSTRASEGLENYWHAVGVEPSKRDGGEAIRSRLKARLGVDLDPSLFAQPADKIDAAVDSKLTEGIEKSLRSKSNARQVALAWLNEITSGAVKRLPDDEREKLVNDLAMAFQGGKPLDSVFASWLRGDNDSSSAWYAAMARGGEHVKLHRLASLTMNVDLRCTRCHDALIESNGHQKDYWSLASMVRRDVVRDDKGHWAVRGTNSQKKTSPIFYERPDGRQSIAEAGIPLRWLGNSDAADLDGKIDTVREWGDAIVGSRSLAHGVVNSLWRLVHDRPLRGGVADAASPPLDDSLVGLEELLVDDLMRSNFNVSRLLAIVLASPATSRSIPETLVRQDAWALDADKVRLAEQAVQAFAAAAPSPMSLPLAKRVDLTMRSIGATLKGVDGIGTVLAQPINESFSSKQKQPSEPLPMASGFPDHADSVPVQWLASINSFDSQVKHLGYLAGLERLPSTVQPAAQAMRKANVPVELTLHRVWWLLQP